MRPCGIHKLVADVTLLAGGQPHQVAMARYADASRYDGQHGWFLPDDHLEHGEHPDEAARRIVVGQLGILPANVRLETVESFGNGAWHLVFHYVAELDEPAEIEPGDNVAEARWFGLDALPPREEVAHDGWALEILEGILARR